MSKSLSTITRGIAALALSVAGLAMFAGIASAVQGDADVMTILAAKDLAATGSITVTWTTPGSSTTPVTQYQVTVGNTSAATVLCTTANTFPANSTASCTFTAPSSLNGAAIYVRGVESSGNIYTTLGGTSGAITLAKPTVPSTLTAAQNANGTITVSTTSVVAAETDGVGTGTAFLMDTKFTVYEGSSVVCNKALTPVTSGYTTASCTFAPSSVGLSVGTAYVFTATLSNAAGTASDSATATLTPYTSPAAPTNVTATVSYSTGTATITWGAPASGGASLTYTVRDAAANVLYNTSGAACSTITATSCTINILYNNGRYGTYGITDASHSVDLPYANVFTVTANGGNSLTATGISNFVTIGAVPTAPVVDTAGAPSGSQPYIVFSGASTGTIWWNAPASAGTIAPTGYSVQLLSCTTQYANSCTASGSPVIVPSTVTSYAFSGLARAAYYNYSVSAVNAAGTGPALTGTTPVANAAAAPGTFTATLTNVTNSTLSASWSAPTTLNGSAITGYTVQLCTMAAYNSNSAYCAANLVTGTLVSLSASTTSYTFSGISALAAGSYYGIYVTAVTTPGNTSVTAAGPREYQFGALVGAAPAVTAVTYTSAGVKFKWGTAPFTNDNTITSVSSFTIYDNTKGVVLCTAAASALSCTASAITAGDSVVVFDTDASGVNSGTTANSGGSVAWGTSSNAAIYAPTKADNTKITSIVSTSDNNGNVLLSWTNPDTAIGYFSILGIGSDGTSFTMTASNRTIAGTLLNYALIPAASLTAASYTYYVSAVNASGSAGAISSATSASTTAICNNTDTSAACVAAGSFGPPTAPLTVTSSGITSTSATFSWTAPVNDSYNAVAFEAGYPVITGYVGTLTAASGATQTCTTTGTSCTFSALTTGAKYVFTVYATTALPAVNGVASTGVSATINGVPSAPTIASVSDYSATGTPTGGTTLVAFTPPAVPGGTLASAFTAINTLVGSSNVWVSSTSGLVPGQAVSGGGVTSGSIIATVVGSTITGCTLNYDGTSYTLQNSSATNLTCQNNKPAVNSLVVAAGVPVGTTIKTVSSTYSSGWTVTLTVTTGTSLSVVNPTVAGSVAIYGYVTLAGSATSNGQVASAASVAGVGIINMTSTKGLTVGDPITLTKSDGTALVPVGSTVATIFAGDSTSCTIGTRTSSTSLVLAGTGCAGLLAVGESLTFASTSGIVHGTSLVSAVSSLTTVTIAANSATVLGDVVTISPYITATATVAVTNVSGTAVLNLPVGSTFATPTGSPVLVTGTGVTAATTLTSFAAQNSACTVGTVTSQTILELAGSCDGLLAVGESLSFATVAGVSHGTATIATHPSSLNVTLTTAPTGTIAVGDVVTIAPHITLSAVTTAAVTSVVITGNAAIAASGTDSMLISDSGKASAYVGTATDQVSGAVTYCTSVLVSTSSSCVFATSSGRSYVFTMQAVNASGASLPATSAAFTTAAVAVAPSAVTVVSSGSPLEVVISWNAPTLTNGSTVVSYSITAATSTISTLTGWTSSAANCVDATTLLSTITGTSAICDFTAANAGVKFKVTATTSAGSTLASVYSTGVPVINVPAAPTGVVEVTSATNGVTINWLPVTGATSYTVKAVGGLTGLTTITGLTTTSYTFGYSTITKGGAYTFTVYAKNSVGTGTGTLAAAEVLADPTSPIVYVEDSTNTTLTATGFYLSWGASAKSSNGGQPVTYTVIGSSLTSPILTATTTSTSVFVPVASLTALVASSYSWTLSASDASGASAGSPLAVSPGSLNYGSNVAAPAAPAFTGAGTIAGLTADGQTALGAGAANADTTASLYVTIPASNATYVTVTLTSPTGTTYTCANTASNVFVGAGSSSQKCYFVGLTPGTVYTYSAVAGNQVLTSATATVGFLTTAASATATPVVTSATASINALGLESITVNWLPVTGATTYIVYVDTANGQTTLASYGSSNSFCTAVLTASSTSCTIANVSSTNGFNTIASDGTATYQAYVVAVGPGGNSIPGTVRNALTGAEVPTLVTTGVAAPNAPTKFVITSGGVGTLNASWTASTTTGLPITGYIVKAIGGTNADLITCSTTTATTCALTGLKNTETYAVNVYALNANPTAASAISTAGTDLAGASGGITWATWTAPDIAPAITSATSTTGVSMAITWAAPVFSLTKGDSAPLTGYTVVATDVKGNSFNCGALAATATTCTLTGLTPATSYTIVVTPSNAVGAGVAASITASTISSTVPGSPTGVTATAGFSTTYGDTATVAWTAPVSTGGAPITSYTATAKNTTTGAVVTCTITGAASALCAALVAGNSYAVTVTATNVVGASAASTPVVVAAFGNPPAVTGVTAIRNANGLQVSWTATATVFGATNSATAVPVLGYLVTATDNLSGQQYSCPYNATYGVLLAPAVTCAIAGLNVGNSYTVSVKAANLLSGLSAAATLITTYVALTPEPVMATFLAVTAKQKSVSALSPTTKTALSGLISTVSDGASITITGYGTTKAIAQARANAAANYLFNNGAAVHITIKTVVSNTVKTALVTVTSN